MPNIILIVSVLLLLLYVILIIYYRSGWLSIEDYVISKEKFPTKVTVIIPARNEETNISACLASIIANNFPLEQLQIIVVDDHSEDRTAEIVRSFSKQHVQLISLKDHVPEKINSYKKKALEV